MSLSPETIAIVKATAPVVAEHAVDITSTMYRILLREHPEVRPYFNMANQSPEIKASGNGNSSVAGKETMAGQQARTLAQSIIAYATHIENLAALGPAVKRITHKHASLDIRPEHYDVVGSCLLTAIKEVLGAAATPAIVSAWAEAYGLLAKILIGEENRLREESEQQPGGWKGWRAFVVMKKEVDPYDNRVASFYLKPTDGGPVPPVKAGQYTCFKVDVPGYGTQHRNYSLSDVGPLKNGNVFEGFRVSIKREPATRNFADGVVSNYFHDHVQEGTVLEVAPAYGDFKLEHSTKPLVLLCAGIGATPIYAMLKAALSAPTTRPIYVIQQARNSAQHPLRHDIAALLESKPPAFSWHVAYSQPIAGTDTCGVDYHTAGRVGPDVIRTVVPAPTEAEFYFTGPNAFMRDVRLTLREMAVPAAQIHLECFGPFADEVEAEPIQEPERSAPEGKLNAFMRNVRESLRTLFGALCR